MTNISFFGNLFFQLNIILDRNTHFILNYGMILITIYFLFLFYYNYLLIASFKLINNISFKFLETYKTFHCEIIEKFPYGCFLQTSLRNIWRNLFKNSSNF